MQHAEALEPDLILLDIGYVPKARAQSELLTAIAAVATDERFVRSGLEGTGEHPKTEP